MQQAIILSSTQNEESKYWTKPSNNADELEKFWQTYFNPFFNNIIKTKKVVDSGWRDQYYIYFSDGSCMYFTSSGALDITYDVNCFDKSQNIIGKDMYIFLFNNGKFTPYNWLGDIASIEPNDGGGKYSTDLNDRDNVVRLCKRDASFCTQLLQLDDWEYKADYPKKL